MKTPFIKSKKGFTIIEVSLVLAIGGLIMLMVFIAWPAIQRSQKDTQRRSVDLPKLFSAINDYKTNNSGKLPDVPTNNVVVSSTSGSGKWKTFYTNYLAQNEGFVDPGGTDYSLSIVTCSSSGTAAAPNNGLAAKAICAGVSRAKSVGGNVLFNTSGALTSSFENQQSTITIVVGATCDGETPVSSTNKTGGTRNFALLYKLESGGVHCQAG